MEKEDLVGKQMRGFLFDIEAFDMLIPEGTQRSLEGAIGTILEYDDNDDTVEVEFEGDHTEWYPASKAIDHLVEEEECDSIFKIGDKVFHIEYGWGEVTDDKADKYYPIDVQFKNSVVSFTKDGQEDISYEPMLSFTEYTLQGFSQERPIVLPEPGELCLVRDSDEEYWTCIEFKNYIPTEEHKFIDNDGDGWRQMKRIKILD